MATIRLHATPDQIEVITAKERFLTVMAGRRWGKTFTCCNRIVNKSFQQDNNRYWYIAPTYAQARSQYNRIRSNEGLKDLQKHAQLQPYPMIEFTNGSTVGFRSFDRPDNLRGDGLDEVWVDEIQDIDEESFWPVIRPLISDRRGTLGISGQFRGKNWYYEQMYVKGIDGPEKRNGFRSWRFPSSSGLVFQSDEGREELEIVKTQLPKMVYEQEYECVPLANQASVFRYDDIEQITNGDSVKNGEAGKKYVIGLDLGRVVDPSALVVFDCSSKRVVYSELRPLKEPHEIGAQHAAQIQRAFNGATIVIDSTGGATGGKSNRDRDAYVKYYRQSCGSVREFTWSYASKRRIIENLQLGIEQGAFTIPSSEKTLLDQLRQYEYRLVGGGKLIYQGPGGHDDDLVAAMAMAYEGYVRHWFGGTPDASKIANAIGV